MNHYVNLTGDSYFVQYVGDWIRHKGGRLEQDYNILAMFEEDGTQYVQAHYSGHGDTYRVTVFPEGYDLHPELHPGTEDRPWPPDWPKIAADILSISEYPGDWDERFNADEDAEDGGE
ncbi:hypothetical protein [Glycomyces artemisiae]|uniref:Uncharacterized protein n=1 Tax=Glycomyces artemisiae TaxID=1076443 RepID=A0A2T0UXA9_9ACTN|nr:hypothetical protein [Glycomyces artemisiae]PRY62563.1 hypothetical protein B0I28_101897 [Glycomyces artemisiae]